MGDYRDDTARRLAARERKRRQREREREAKRSAKVLAFPVPPDPVAALADGASRLRGRLPAGRVDRARVRLVHRAQEWEVGDLRGARARLPGRPAPVPWLARRGGVGVEGEGRRASRAD